MLKLKGSIDSDLLGLVPNVLVETSAEDRDESVSSGGDFRTCAQKSTKRGPALPGQLGSIIVLSLVPQGLVRSTAKDLNGSI